MCPGASTSNYKNTSNCAARNLSGVFRTEPNVVSMRVHFLQCVPSCLWVLRACVSWILISLVFPNKLISL